MHTSLSSFYLERLHIALFFMPAHLTARSFEPAFSSSNLKPLSLCARLPFLFLPDNKIGAEGAPSLAKALEANSALTSLDLSGEPGLRGASLRAKPHAGIAQIFAHKAPLFRAFLLPSPAHCAPACLSFSRQATESTQRAR